MPAVTPAPAPGTDPAFDKAWAAVLADLGDKVPPDARDILWDRMSRYGNEVPAQPAKPVPADPPADAKPRTLVVPAPQGEPYWWDDPVQASTIDHYILSRRTLGHTFEGGLLIVGPAGSGKTQSVAHAITRINAAQGSAIRLTKMDCPTITDPQKWFGRREVDATGTHYHKSDFIEAVERGDVILLDEVTRLHPHLHNPVMTLLDGSNSVALSDLNVTITRHPQTVFLATANIGAQYGGTHRMDWAMRERFPNAIERGFPPREDEIRVIVSRTGCDEDGAARLVDIALRTRQMFDAGDLRAPISTRTLIAAGWWVASGLNEQEALDLTAIPLYDPDANGVSGQESERQQVRRIVEGKFQR